MLNLSIFTVVAQEGGVAKNRLCFTLKWKSSVCSNSAQTLLLEGGGGVKWTPYAKDR